MTTAAPNAHPAAQSPAAAGSSGQALRSSATSLDNRMVMVLIGARIAANILRSPRFYQALVVAAVASVAVARIGKEDQASAFQHFQMLGDRRSAHVHARGNFPHRTVAFAHTPEDRSAGRIAQSVEGPLNSQWCRHLLESVQL